MSENYDLGVTDFCHNCRFWYSNESEGNKEEQAARMARGEMLHGQCRRRFIAFSDWAGFPSAYSDMWCGEHEPNAEVRRERHEAEINRLIEENKASMIPGQIFRPGDSATWTAPALQVGKTIELKKGQSYDAT